MNNKINCGVKFLLHFVFPFFFLIGKRRATYVKSLSTKNVLYKDDTVIAGLKGEDRTKCLNAMRARRARQKKKELQEKQR